MEYFDVCLQFWPEFFSFVFPLVFPVLSFAVLPLWRKEGCKIIQYRLIQEVQRSFAASRTNHRGIYINAIWIKSRINDFILIRVIDRADDSVSASLPPKFWLLKSEPDEYSIDDLAQSTDSTGFWDVSTTKILCNLLIFNLRAHILSRCNIFLIAFERFSLKVSNFRAFEISKRAITWSEWFPERKYCFITGSETIAAPRTHTIPSYRIVKEFALAFDWSLSLLQ